MPYMHQKLLKKNNNNNNNNNKKHLESDVVEVKMHCHMTQ